MATSRFPGLDACIDDVVTAVKPPMTARSEGLPSDIRRFSNIIPALKKSGQSLPKGYPDDLVAPFVKVLKAGRQLGFQQILRRDPGKGERQKRLLMDISQAIRQRRHFSRAKGKAKAQAAVLARASDAAQELVADLYDGFFDQVAQLRVGIPAKAALAPLAAWGIESHHETWTADQTEVFGPRVPIVMTPVGTARGGLLSWAMLAHEVVGHDVLCSYGRLLDELKDKVWEAMRQAGLEKWSEYWASRVDEAASDVMGVQNMGPAYGIALIGYIRAMRKVQGRRNARAELRRDGEESDPYPADFLRAYLVMEAIRLLKSAGMDSWARDLKVEARELRRPWMIDGKSLKQQDRKEAMGSAALVAKTLVTAPLKSLKDSHGKAWAIRDLQDWTLEDEDRVKELRHYVATGTLPIEFPDGAYAAHAVAAAVKLAVVEGVAVKPGGVKQVFDGMLNVLQEMHRIRQGT